MGTPPTWRTYADKENTPVPLPRFRCKATAVEHREGASHSTLTHPCKISVDHDGDHRCICGKTWRRIAEVAAK